MMNCHNIVLDIETGSVWDITNLSLSRSDNFTQLSSSHLCIELIRSLRSDDIKIRILIDVTRDCKIELKDLDDTIKRDFNIRLMEQRAVYRYVLVSKKSLSVTSSDIIYKLVEGAYGYYEFLIPMLI